MGHQASTHITANPDFKRHEYVYFQQSRSSATRAAYVSKASRDGGYELRVIANGTISTQRKVSEMDARRQMRAVIKDDPDNFDQKRTYARFAADFKKLALDMAAGGKKATRLEGLEAGGVPYLSLCDALERQRYQPRSPKLGALRLGTLNVCHLNDACPKEKIRNLAAVIRLSRVDLVVLQEVHTSAHGALQRIIDQISVEQVSGGSWSYRVSPPTGTKGPPLGECYALLYNAASVAAFFTTSDSDASAGVADAAGTADGVSVESFIYEQSSTGSREFRKAVEWGSVRRVDFAFGGAGAARLPGFFWLRSANREHSVVITTLHAAFSDKAVRKRQLDNLSSLLPQRALDAQRCVFALMGDFNSDAHTTGSVPYAQTEAGRRVGAALQRRGNFVSLADHSDPTGVGGWHYDEVIVQADAMGAVRKAKVFPPHKELVRLGGGEAFFLEAFTPLTMRTGADGGPRQRLATFKSCVFTDHYLLHVDVRFARAPRDSTSVPPTTLAQAPGYAPAEQMKEDLAALGLPELKLLAERRGITVVGDRRQKQTWVCALQRPVTQPLSTTPPRSVRGASAADVPTPPSMHRNSSTSLAPTKLGASQMKELKNMKLSELKAMAKK